MKKSVWLEKMVVLLVIMLLGVTVYAGAGDIKIRMKDGTVITDPVKYCLDCINNKNNKYDEDEREQCVYTIAGAKPDPKIVLPTLIRHLKSDPDEDMRSLIAGTIIKISQSKEVIDALKEVANEPITEEQKEKDLKKFGQYKNNKIQWNEEYTAQGAALSMLANIGDYDSIPELTKWLEKYNVDLFFMKRGGDEKYEKACGEVIDNKLTDKKMTVVEKLRLARGMIMSLGARPEDYEAYFRDALKDSDDEIVGEGLKTILEIKNRRTSSQEENVNVGKFLKDTKEFVKSLRLGKHVKEIENIEK
jgi:hypothetical protein